MKGCRSIFRFPEIVDVSFFAPIEAFDPFYVPATHLFGPTNGDVGIGNWHDGGLTITRKGIPSIMHDRAIVIRGSQIVGLDLPEVVLHSLDDVLINNANMLVTIAARLLMIEAKGV